MRKCSDVNLLAEKCESVAVLAILQRNAKVLAMLTCWQRNAKETAVLSVLYFHLFLMCLT